jgi:nucleotide-binding universal stress UspA family protein
MEKILVAVDLSDIASKAIDYAASFAGVFKSHIHILHVEVPIPAYLGNEIVQPVIPTDNADEEESIKRDLLAMAEYLHQRGVDADFELAKGPIVETIIEKATQYKAELIILGAHNHGFLYRAFIGSVCSGVSKHSPCPVMIIPAK